MKKAISPNPTAITAQAGQPIMAGGRKSGAATAREVKPRSAKVPANRREGYNGEERDFAAEQVLAALMAIKRGDFSIRLPVGWTGIGGKVADTFNEVAELMSNSTDELNRVSRVVGKE